MIYPEEFPRHGRDISNEHTFYRRFQKEIPHSWNVYYSLTLITPDVPMREIDFLVVSPYGITSVELKNGKWRFQKGKWEFFNARSRDWQPVEGKSYDGPVNQASSQIQLFREFLLNHNQWKDLVYEEYFSSAVFFLKNSTKEFSHTGQRKTHLIGKDKLENHNLESVLQEIQNNFQREPIPVEAIQAIHEIILKNLNLVTKDELIAINHEDKLLSLTKEQYSLIQGVKENKRSIVFGVAGSGKSLLAGKLALDFAKEKHRVLLWQGSKALFNLWQSELKQHPESESITLVQHPKEITSFEFDILIADQIESILDGMELKEWKLYFSDWFWQSKQWVLFLDRSYRMQNHPILDSLLTSVRQTWDITRNIRNSNEIISFANLLVEGIAGNPNLESFTDVQLISVVDEDDFIEKIKYSVAYLKRRMSVLAEPITILYPEEAIFQDKPKLKEFLNVREYSLVPLVDFQGLEESVGILLGFSDWEQTKTRWALSKAILHFRDVVCILYEERERESIASLLQKNGSSP
ncbi:hypothetical protein LPTSP4_01130 [Leptospira ryugenii]|uniref:NERD domain-containing protein n=1 Tax=Leptospira ryugenii TaxID=1917863 RepID=A0A2P2DVH2_9LEPT|nr:hypothetical protein LPTSP4_01130 [Leptospira ryugenii]